MQVTEWVQDIEQAIDDPPALEAMRPRLAADEDVTTMDREILDGRIGTYLADADAAGDQEWEDQNVDLDPERFGG